MSLLPIGLLGGAFDPIHFGHLRLGLEAAERLGLEQVRFIPTGIPPHRAAPCTSAPHRFEMTRIAVAGNPLFSLDDREIRRAGPCYTVDTLEALRAELGSARPLCLLLGGDAFLGLATWHRWRELFGLCHIVVANRPGITLATLEQTMPEALRSETQTRRDAAATLRAPAGTIVPLPIPPLDISSTAIRGLLAAGRSPRYLLPHGVLEYIGRHGLYRENNAV